MKIQLEIGDELSFVRDAIETVIERALGEVAAAGRPEYAAGFYAAAASLADDIETRYAAWLEQERAAVRSMTRKKSENNG